MFPARRRLKVPPESSLLGYRVGQVESQQAEMRSAIKSIDANLHVLADVQRRLSSLGDAELRLRAIELELPTLKLTRKWVLAIVTMMGGTVGAAMLALVVR